MSGVRRVAHAGEAPHTDLYILLEGSGGAALLLDSLHQGVEIP